MTLLRADVEENLERAATPLRVVAAVLTSRGVQVCLLHRLAHAAAKGGLVPVSVVLMRISQLLFGVDIHYRAVVGPGLVLRHPAGIVIGRDVVIGRRVRVFQHVTLGNRLSGGPDRPDGMPVIGDDVHLFAGCVVLGPVHVGHGASVGANAVLLQDCPPGGTVTAPRPTVLPPEAPRPLDS